MEAIKLNCTYEERISSKSGKPYKAIFVKICDKYEKMILVDVPEQTLIETTYQHNKN